MDKRYYSELYSESNEIHLKKYIIRGGTYEFCWHKSIELMLVLKGEIEVFIEGQLNTLQQNDILWMNSNLGHSIFSKDINSIILILEISPEFINNNFINYDDIVINCVSNSVTRNNSIFSQMRLYMAQIMYYAMKDKPIDRLSEKIFTSVLISEIFQNFSSNKPEDIKKKNISMDTSGLEGALDYIDRNYKNKIKLEDVASLSGYNRTYFSTLFRKKLGITFNEYIMRVRLRHAIECLSNLDASIMDIALENGFSDSRTFLRYMKKYCGKTPENYKFQLKRYPEMARLYAVNRYIKYPDTEVENILNTYRKIFVYNSNNKDMTISKNQILKEVEEHCNSIIKVVDSMF